VRDLFKDARYGFRLLGKSPAFTAVAVLCLALGIGGNAAIFSVFNRIALQPLPYGTDEELVTLRTRFPGVNLDRSRVSEPELKDLRQRLRSVELLTAFVPIDANLEFRPGDEPTTAVAVVGEAGIFRALGVRPALGRDFRPDESEFGKHLVVILSHHLWQREYGGDPNVIGRKLVLDTEEHEIVGVLPSEFRLPFATSAELFAPLAWEPGFVNFRENRYLSVFARLRTGSIVDDLQRELDALAGELRREYPDSYPAHARFEFVATTARDELFAPVRPAVLALMLAVGAVLLIACVNVASLLLARATTRRGELALRAAIGAQRGRLIRQVLVESLVLSLLGAGGGLLVAFWGVDALIALGPDALPHLRTVSVDRSVLLFAVGCAVATGLAFGLVPALQASRADLTTVLSASSASAAGGGRATDTRQALGVRNLLLVVEVALALLLLVAAGLALKSLHDAERADLGFRSDRVMTMSIRLSQAQYPYSERSKRIRFFAELFQRARTGPNPVELAAVSHLPLSGSNREYTCEVENSPAPAFEVQIRVATPDYFDAMGIPVKAGRDFHPSDTPKSGVVVDEVLAHRNWGNQDPIGKRIRLSGDNEWLPVLGVVGSVRHDGAAAMPPPHVYLSFVRQPQLRMTLVAEVDRPPEEIARRVRGIVRDIDPQLAVYDIKTMNQRVYESLALYRFSTLLLVVFAALALLLAVMGVYAVMAYTLAQRRREMAVRLVLGAEPRQLVAMLVRRGMRTAAIGIAVGVALSPLVGAGLSALLFGGTWIDAGVLVAAAVGVFAASSVACLVAARHVVDIDPGLALRAE